MTVFAFKSCIFDVHLLKNQPNKKRPVKNGPFSISCDNGQIDDFKAQIIHLEHDQSLYKI